MWVEFVVSSLHTPLQFPSPRKPLPKSNSIWNGGHDYIRTPKCLVSERVSINPRLSCVRNMKALWACSRYRSFGSCCCNWDLYITALLIIIFILLSSLLFQDKHNKVFLNWLISQRKKKLGHLKNGRFERYLVLSKELDLPLLESPHTKWNKYKFRKFKIGVEIKEKKRFPKWPTLE